MKKIILIAIASIALTSCYTQVEEYTIKTDSVYWIQGDSAVFIGLVNSVE